MDDFPERRGPMSKMCGLLTFGWQVELENEAIVGDNSVIIPDKSERGQSKVCPHKLQSCKCDIDAGRRPHRQ